MIEKYTRLFSNLRTDKNRNRYPSITTHRAPHKPLLLLSIMDLIAQGVINENFIEPSFELVDTFNTYYSSVMPLGSKTSMAYPFSRLQTDGFWQRVTKPGFDSEIEYNIKSMPRLREVLLGARMDEELFQLMCNPETRERLRAVLIDIYFASEIRPILVEQGRVNYDAYEYGKKLLADPDRKYDEREKSNKARDQGFRKVIVVLYDHRFALCGIRMMTPEGHTVVEAAHIRPWHESNDDRPTNGMALCRLCHWYFDEGLMGVGKGYEVLVSKRVQVEQNLPGHILTLRDRPIFTHSDNIYRPAQENFDWHRRKAFRAT
ncbi:MAG: HNH endonuclease [Deltaproteobacteria bacterium]|nr:HNH endonuclease [Deltaproteobacteria bacterium]